MSNLTDGDNGADCLIALLYMIVIFNLSNSSVSQSQYKAAFNSVCAGRWLLQVTLNHSQQSLNALWTLLIHMHEYLAHCKALSSMQCASRSQVMVYDDATWTNCFCVFLILVFSSTMCVLNHSVFFSFRHWEAVKKWDEAIQLTPDNPVLYEMKSQVYYKPVFDFFT